MLTMYKSHIIRLQIEKWHGKSFRIFFFGDYEFQSKCYGLSGPSGVRPCLYCLCQKKSMDVATSDRQQPDKELRTLESLAADHEKFVEVGENPSQVKHFNNALRPVILPISLDDVIVPVLHLDLGIYAWVFDAFEAEVRQLDVKLAMSAAATPADSATYADLSSLYTQLRNSAARVSESHDRLQTSHQYLQAIVVRAEDRPELEAIAEQIQQDIRQFQEDYNKQADNHQNLQSKINAAEKSKNFIGPCSASIEPVLQAHGIQRQAYHGGAFIGNHVHQALKADTISSIVSAPVTVITQRHPTLTSEAQAVQAALPVTVYWLRHLADPSSTIPGQSLTRIFAN